MFYLKLAHEAQLHREAYIAVLNGLLQTPTAKRHFAQTISITPQYLSYLLNPYDRTPGPDLAHKMVDILPLDATERDNLLEHLLLSSEHRLKTHLTLQQEFPQVDVATHITLIHQAQAAANFSADPHQAKAQQQTIRAAGGLLLNCLNPATHPLDFAQLCIWLHSAESAGNLHANAIYHAKKARAVLGHFVRTDFVLEERERFDDLVFTALRSEAVTYHNLQVDRPAYDLCCAGETLPGIEYRSQDWLPHLYRDKINAYSGLPRFSIRKVEHWATEGKQLCEKVTHDQAPLWAFMLDRSLAQAYLHYGNSKKAITLLQQLTEEVNCLPVAGILHRVAFLKTYAEALWAAGDRQHWEAVIGSALQLAHSAGLTHQITEIKRHYGDAVIDPHFTHFTQSPSP